MSSIFGFFKRIYVFFRELILFVEDTNVIGYIMALYFITLAAILVLCIYSALFQKKGGMPDPEAYKAKFKKREKKRN